MGYAICLANAKNKGNIINWSLVKCKRITQSVWAAKFYEIAYKFNIKAIIKVMLESILKSAISPILYINSNFCMII